MSLLPDLGRYAAYVWPAFAIALSGLGLLAGLSVRRMKVLERQAQAARSRRGGDA